MYNNKGKENKFCDPPDELDAAVVKQGSLILTYAS